MPFKITLFSHKDWKEYVFIYKSTQKCGDPLGSCFLRLQRRRWEAKASVPWNKEKLHFSLNCVLSELCSLCVISCLVLKKLHTRSVHLCTW